MNLKRKLRLLYANQPPLKKKSFARQLLQNATWQNLHPIRAAILTHAWLTSAIFVLSALTVAGAGVSVIVMMRQAPSPPDKPLVTEPPVIETTTVATTSVPAVITILQTETTTTESTVHITETQPIPETSALTATAETSAAPVTTASETSSQTTVVITEITPETTTTTSSAASETAAKTRETVTASLCCHDAELSDEKEISFESCGYPAYDVKRALGLNDMQFMGNVVLAAEQILTGTIQEKQNVVIDGNPWTKLKIAVEECHYGSAAETAEIWLAGGTVPLAEYLAVHPENAAYSGWDAARIVNADLYESGAFSREYAVGESYLWFLSSKQMENNADPVWTAVYGSDVTIMRRDGIRYVSANPYQSFSMLADAVEVQIKKR